ncbi:MAG TPA: EAL domain-containing protein [Eoetvoesiella sp.]
MPFQLKRLKSIYARMFLVICAAAIPTFIGLCFYVFQQRAHLADLSLKNAQTYVDLAAQDEIGLFNSTRKILDTVVTAPVIKQGDWKLCQRYLSNLLGVLSSFIDIGIIGPDGEPLCNSQASEDRARTTLADRPYFRRALEEAGLIIGNYQIGRFTQTPTIVVATRFHDQNNQIRGVVYAGLHLSEFVKSIKETQLAPEASLMVLDRDGVILSAFPANVGVAGQPITDQQILSLINRSDRGSSIIQGQDGTESFISHTRAGTAEDPRAITVVYQYPTEALLHEINNGFWVSGAITLFLVMLALAMGWAGTHAIVGRNIRFLTEAAKRLRRREFTTRIGNKVTGLEFTEIAAQLDKMTEELSVRERQWEQSAQRQLGQNKILKLIAQDHSMEETLEALVIFSQEQIDNTIASIVMLTPDGKRIGSCIAPNLPSAYKNVLINIPIGPEAGSCGTAMYHNRSVISENIPTDPKWALYREHALKHGLHACWSYPIRSPENRVLGSFALYFTDKHSPLPEELQVAEMASELAAVTIEHRRQSEALVYQSRHDTLTGLLNRSVFSSQVSRAINEAKSKGNRFYIVILNLDGFKEVNDALGHQFGDLLLEQVGKRLQDLFGALATVARSGGDEFAMLIKDAKPSLSIHCLIEEVRQSVKQPFLLNGIQIQTSASMGIAQYPKDGSHTTLLMRRAETAMYQAKSEGVGHAFYDWKKDQQTPNQLMLMSNLRQALKEEQFVLHYQPKISLKTKKTIGFEALIRWQNPMRGLLYPSDFMSVIELSDLIHPLSLWVLETAVAQCKTWREQGHQVTIAVNVSARNLLDIGLPGKIRDILTQYAVEPEWLELEITESSIMVDPARSLDVLTKIHEIGVSIAIDDFGTGYSSLAYLQKLPVDNLKIDRSFVNKMNEQSETLSIVSSIIGLAHNLKLTVTAEGIEDQAMLTKLTELGCDCAQGYYIGKPMAHDAIQTWLSSGFRNGTLTGQH